MSSLTHFPSHVRRVDIHPEHEQFSVFEWLCDGNDWLSVLSNSFSHGPMPHLSDCFITQLRCVSTKEDRWGSHSELTRHFCCRKCSDSRLWSGYWDCEWNSSFWWYDELGDKDAQRMQHWMVALGGVRIEEGRNLNLETNHCPKRISHEWASWNRLHSKNEGRIVRKESILSVKGSGTERKVRMHSLEWCSPSAVSMCCRLWVLWWESWHPPSPLNRVLQFIHHELRWEESLAAFEFMKQKWLYLKRWSLQSKLNLVHFHFWRKRPPLFFKASDLYTVSPSEFILCLESRFGIFAFRKEFYHFTQITCRFVEHGTHSMITDLSQVSQNFGIQLYLYQNTFEICSAVRILSGRQKWESC